MKKTLIIIILYLPIVAWGQIFKPDTVHNWYCNPLTRQIVSHKPQQRFIDTCKMEHYNPLTDTPHNDRKGYFNVVGTDTIRNGVFEYYQIKKRLKNKEQ